jgi:hypothetical protein
MCQVSVQQVGQHRAVPDIARRHHYRVDQLAAGCRRRNALSSEVPVVSFLRLVHLEIAGPCLHSGQAINNYDDATGYTSLEQRWDYARPQ